ncbi:MAG: universal stress protein [Desulfomonilia bacterium]|jgi:nucleotide-binding universal stress UspA family protein
MFKKILYPTDFSEVAKKALPYIVGLKGAGTKEVIILYIIDERGIDSFRNSTAIDALAVEKEWEELALNEISSLEDELKEQGFIAKAQINKGIPFREILRVAEEENVSAIIMGSHGKSNIVEMLLGSVTDTVVRKAQKPVLIVRR